MPFFSLRWTWLPAVVAALTCMAGAAAAATADVDPFNWGVRTSDGVFAGDGGVYTVGFDKSNTRTYKAFWEFALPHLGTITGVTFSIDAGTINIPTTYKSVTFADPGDAWEFYGRDYTHLAGLLTYGSFAFHSYHQGTTVNVNFTGGGITEANALQGGTYIVTAVMGNPGTLYDAYVFGDTGPANTMQLHLDYVATPEPAAVSLFGAGALAIAAAFRRRRA